MSFALVLSFHSSLSVHSPFFFNATATTEIYTPSLHDALPIFVAARDLDLWEYDVLVALRAASATRTSRSEEHTSELQSLSDLVCRLLLEKKKKKTTAYQDPTSM